MNCFNLFELFSWLLLKDWIVVLPGLSLGMLTMLKFQFLKDKDNSRRKFFILVILYA